MPKTGPRKPQTFESALAEIEGLVARMEGGKLTLEDSLTAYRRGAELLQYCHSALQEAQQQVKVFEDGSLNVLQSIPGDGDDSE